MGAAVADDNNELVRLLADNRRNRLDYSKEPSLANILQGNDPPQMWGGLKSYLPEQPEWMRSAQNLLGRGLASFPPEAMLAASFLGPKVTPVPRKSVFDWSRPGGGSRETKVGNSTLTYGVGKDGSAELILIETPPAHRGQGSARSALQQFVSEADQNGMRLSLNADPMGKGVSKSGLERLYESVGFIKNRDPNSPAEYVRYPKGD